MSHQPGASGRERGGAAFASQTLYAPENAAAVLGAVCGRHPGRAPGFICSACCAAFCRDCVKVFGASAGAICRSCGSLCLPFEEVRRKVQLQSERRVGFGPPDFGLALRYPLAEWLTTLGLGVLYGAGLFSLPFFAVRGVGFALGAFGLFPAFIVNSLMFGCAMSVINTTAAGRKDCREALDISRQLADPGEVFANGCCIIFAAGWPLALGVVSGSGMVIRLAAVWAFVYYPSALLLRASTGSFWATLNPAEALRAAGSMGAAYWRLLLMYMAVSAGAGACVALAVLKVMSWGFSLPSFLALGLLVGPVIFYANMVIACIIGRAVFKTGFESA